MSGVSLHCHDCGRLISADRVRRRNVVVSTSTSGTSGTAAGRPGWMIASSTTARVSLCPDCDDDRDEQERERRAKSDRDCASLLTFLLYMAIPAAFLALAALVLLGVILFAALSPH